ncbi:MAG: hypothetical protein QOI66_109, partial [Myxococcales bacterium]|nr:hypothetical protein [Myxococcales bacterium]
SSVLDKLITAGPRTTLVPATACLVGRRLSLLTLAEAPALLLGAEATALAAGLGAGGRLAAAQDVFVARLNQQATEPRPAERERYLVQQSANWAAAPRGGVAPQLGLCSIVILVRDNLLLTTECIESIYRHTAQDFELILIDNGSAPDVPAFVAGLQTRHRNVVSVRNPENEGFPFGVNQGLAAARGEYVVLLNNDVVVTAGWLGRQLAVLGAWPEIGLVGPATNATSGPQLVGTATYAGLGAVDAFAEQWALEHAGEMAFVPRLTGLCMVMRRSLVETIGGFDTIFGVGNCEDDDFCLRVLRSGRQIAIAYDVFIHHHGSATFKAMSLRPSELVTDNWALFCQKWQHDSGVHTSEALRQLADRGPFDADADFIPVDYRAVFHAGAPPLDVETSRSIRLLCVPDWRDDGWTTTVEAILRTFSNHDPLAVIVRVDPPNPATVERAVEAIKALLARLGKTVDEAPDIVIEASALSPRRRGGLYTAASAYVHCPGGRDHYNAREAAACGLPLLPATPEDLRRFVDQHRP